MGSARFAHIALPFVFGIFLGGGVAFNSVASQPTQGLVITCGPACDTPEQAERRRLREEREQRFKAKVDEVVGRLGSHRRAEAERLVRMQEAAEAARPKQLTPVRTANNKGSECSERRIPANRSFTSQVSEFEAREKAQVFSTRECPRGVLTCGGITCQRNAIAVPGGARQWAERNRVTGLVTYQCTLTATRMQRFCEGSRVSEQ